MAIFLFFSFAQYSLLFRLYHVIRPEDVDRFDELVYSRELLAAVRSKYLLAGSSGGKYLHLFRQQSIDSAASFDSLPCSSAVVACQATVVPSSTVGALGSVAGPFGDPMGGGGGGPPLMRPPPPDHHHQLHHQLHQQQQQQLPHHHHRQSIVSTIVSGAMPDAYVSSRAADTRIDLSALDAADDDDNEDEDEDEEARRQRHQYHLDLQHQQHQQQHHENALAAAASVR